MAEALKEIVAIIRPERWRATQQAIFEAGATGVTQQRMLGRGQQSGLQYMSMIQFDGPMRVTYLPKRLVSCVVEDTQVSAVVDAIIKANQTGNHGDGKIFVCPVADGIRVRTGEWGSDSVEGDQLCK